MALARLIAVPCTLALVLALALPAVASAGTGTSDLSDYATTVTTASCKYSTSSVFAPWGDPAFYYLVPGGNAEAKKHGWTFSGAASVGSGTSLLAGRKSFSLDTGGQATSPEFCLTLDAPTMRFVVNDPGKTSAALKVEGLVECAWGGTCTIPLGTISSSGKGLRLVPPMYLLANVSALFSNNGLTSMQLRFTSTSGKWDLDDVYVDPFKRV